jgi:hypothetical protein
MTQIETQTGTALDAPDRGDRRTRWPLVATAAGLLGGLATIVLDGRTVGADDVTFSHQLFVDLNPAVYRVSMVLGYAAVVLLLVLAAQWRRRVEGRVPGSTAAHLVPLGLVASAAGLTYGYGWKGALGNYIPGAFEEGLYDDQGLYVYYLLNDFGAYIGWLGVVVAAGAVAYMALRERTVSRWLGWFSLLPIIQSTVMVVGMGVAGTPALLAPIWLVVTGLGLTFGRSTITR